MALSSPTIVIKRNMAAAQDYYFLAARSVTNVFRRPRYVADAIQQADLIGVGSLPIVVLTGMFTGMVLALQSANTLNRFGSLPLIGQLVSLSMIRELGPVLTSLMVAGRNASGMASELGSMKVTEQIDAMRALGTDPSKKLVTPRVIATTFMLFFLTIISDLVGLVGGYFISYLLLGLDSFHHSNTEELPPDTVHKAIIFEDVAISLEDLQVLNGISFELKRGETKILLGIAGAGKSTILKLCLGLIKPDRGRIYVLGHEITSMTEEQLFELRNKVGIVFQESALFDSLTVRDNVAFRMIEEKLPEEEINRRVREALRF